MNNNMKRKHALMDSLEDDFYNLSTKYLECKYTAESFAYQIILLSTIMLGDGCPSQERFIELINEAVNRGINLYIKEVEGKNE